MCCHNNRLPVPEATKVSRLPGLQSHPSPNWQESPHSLHSRAHTTRPVSVGSLRADSRPRTHTTGHTTLSRTRPRSQLLESRELSCFYWSFHYQLCFITSSFKLASSPASPPPSYFILCPFFFYIWDEASLMYHICLQIPRLLLAVFWPQCGVTCALRLVLGRWWRPWRGVPPEAPSSQPQSTYYHSRGI
jgi:hypothetical protein